MQATKAPSGYTVTVTMSERDAERVLAYITVGAPCEKEDAEGLAWALRNAGVECPSSVRPRGVHTCPLCSRPY